MADKSELYREMCDTPEIQEGHEWKEGDWAYYKNTCGSIEPSVVSHWLAHTGVNDDAIFFPSIDWYLEHIKEGYITLIRSYDGYSVDWRSASFFYDHVSPTPEQTLITVFMYSNHGKTWDGKEWVKE